MDETAYGNALQLWQTPEAEEADGEQSLSWSRRPSFALTAPSSLAHALDINAQPVQPPPPVFIPSSVPFLPSGAGWPTLTESRANASVNRPWPQPPFAADLSSLHPPLDDPLFRSRGRNSSTPSWSTAWSSAGPTTPAQYDGPLQSSSTAVTTEKWIPRAIPEQDEESERTAITWWPDGNAAQAFTYQPDISPATMPPTGPDEYFPVLHRRSTVELPPLTAISAPHGTAQVDDMDAFSLQTDPNFAPNWSFELPDISTLGRSEQGTDDPTYLDEANEAEGEDGTHPPASIYLPPGVTQSDLTQPGPTTFEQSSELAMPKATIFDQIQIRHLIRPFLNSVDKILGERGVIILAPTIASRAYGNDRRSLLPPPSVLLLGPAWFETRRDQHPNLTVTMELVGSREQQQKLRLDGTSESGALLAGIDVELPLPPLVDGDSASVTHGEEMAEFGASEEPIWAARGVSLGLRVLSRNTSDEQDHQAPVVTRIYKTDGEGVSKPAPCIASLRSTPMQFVSKLGAKRIPLTATTIERLANDPVILHGSVIALYSRTRKTASATRYMRSSSSAASFPVADWQRMTGDATSLPFDRELAPDQTALFQVDYDSWDPYLIYAVDHLAPCPAGLPDVNDGANKPFREAPVPPNHALPSDGAPLPIRYNQPVVLQCLHTGIFTPVMIVREVSTSPTAYCALGSVATEPAVLSTCAPGELLGDCIPAQTKVAFEVYTATIPPETIDAVVGWPGCGTYLSSDLRDVVSTAAMEERVPSMRQVGRSVPPRSRVSITQHRPRLSSGRPPALSRRGSADGGGGGPLRSGPSSRRGSVPDYLVYTQLPRPDFEFLEATRSAVPERSGSPPPELRTTWSQSIHETSVWCLAPVDIARYSFYIPPGDDVATIERVPRVLAVHSASDFVGPMAMVAGYQLFSDDLERLLVLEGESFAPCHWAWFDAEPASISMVVAETQMLVLPPRHVVFPSDYDGTQHGLAIVRSDGVVFRQPDHLGVNL